MFIEVGLRPDRSYAPRGNAARNALRPQIAVRNSAYTGAKEKKRQALNYFVSSCI